MCKSTTEPRRKERPERDDKPEDDDALTEEEEEDDDDEEEQDMRWRLTSEEKEAVRRLQQAADQEDLYYQNIFELAKYVLVVKSLVKTDTVAHRVDVALKRLRKRDAWRKRLEMDRVADDPLRVHGAVVEACPGHFLQCYECDAEHGRTVVTTHMAHTPWHYVRHEEDGYRNYLAAACFRMDLGAVDLNEARRGVVVATVADRQWSLGRAWKYMKFVKYISPDMKDMHPHTVKAVHAQVPALVAHLVPAVKHVLPRKVAERIHLYPSLKDMDEALRRVDENSSNNNDDDGNEPLSPQEWARRRYQRYQETVAKLSLED